MSAKAPRGSSDGRPGRRLSQLAGIPVSTLRAVGVQRTRSLGALGIESVLDLLTYYPRRYEDWSRCVPIDQLSSGDQASVVARVVGVTSRRGRSGRGLVEVSLTDGTGSLTCTFFNQPWRSRQLAAGVGVVAAGKISAYRGALQMANPSIQVASDELETIETGRIVAIYPESERSRVGSTALGRFVDEALERAKELADPLSAEWRRRLDLVDRTTAFRSIHRPDTQADQERARRRLAFDELWRLQIFLVMRKRAAEEGARGIAHAVVPRGGQVDLVARFLERLPFLLTRAQRHVLDEIAEDLAGPVPMHRLLQGDVGSGKSVVALAALLYAVQGGHQGALMVPTEVLAEQHLLAASRLLAGLEVPDGSRLGGQRPLRVELLTSRTTPSERARLRDGLGRLDVDILVGTHALLGEDVLFRSLGVVVIDEQHRFGVDQRAALREKGSGEATAADPDLLVMTATPIPRTAAMTVYGDLDYSVLDELPPGRLAVRTVWIKDEAGEAGVWDFVREEVGRGHQGFVVCPLVQGGDQDGGAEEGVDEDQEESDDGGGQGGTSPGLPLHSAVEEVARLRAGALASCRVGLLHGQLPSRQKQDVMAAFRDGTLDVLVATTVVEVGVDVANATVMVIEDADRFGIAQLHQLRGRVGRSDKPSACFLLARLPGDDGRRRLEALEATSDGFELAEVDLDLRGEGTVLGARQKGRTDLKLASLRRDRDLVLAAREVAEAVVEEDRGLEAHEVLADDLRLFLGDGETEYLFRS